MNSRIRQFISRFSQYQLPAYLVTHPVHISYLTRYPAEDAWLLVFPDQTFYLTDSRYILAARQALRGVTVKTCRLSLMATALEIINKKRVKRIGLDARHISLSAYRKLKRGCQGGIHLIIKDRLVDEMRLIKTAEEICNIQKAIEVTRRAYDFSEKIIKPGITEHEIFLRLERHVKLQGYAFSFQPIVASGANSCYPHARITNRKIRTHDIVLVDMGIDVKGYKSDLTRMFFLGKIPPLVKKITQAVADAQLCAIDKIRPGIKASALDEEARKFLRKRKLDKFFGHSLGHGVGLEVHESPSISQKSKVILKPGMVFTIEPAVYIPYKFGIRLEDMVLVTQKGCQILSH